MDQVLARVRSQYGHNNPKIVDQWEEWAAEAPESDNVQEYVEAHPEKFRIPFRDLLFGDLAVSSEAVFRAASRRKRDSKPKFVQVETTDCVQWKGNGGKGHLVEPRKPLGAATFYDEPTRKRKQPASKKKEKAPVKSKGKPTGRSRVVEKALPVLSGSDSDKPSVPIAKRRKGTTGRSVREHVEEPLLSSCCESSDTGDEGAVVRNRVPSSRCAAAAANGKMTEQCCPCSDEDDGSDVSDESHSGRVSVRPAIGGLTLRGHSAGGRRIAESDDEEDEDVGAAATGSDCEEDGCDEPHCDDDAEVGDDVFDDSIYATPDELGFMAIKPGPKQRVGSSWRDATYIRIYGCASYYLNWQFKNIVTNTECRIDYVVKNSYVENDTGEFYYTCSRLGSCSSSYDYIKCIELMNTQKKKRVYEWIKRSSPRSSKPSSKKKGKQQWPGWAMLDEDGNDIVA